MKIFCKLLFVITLFSLQINAQQITVNNSLSNQQLITNFINGTCTSVSNFQFNGYTFSGGIKSWGYFNKGQSNFPFDEGIVLTTGKLTAAPGPKSAVLSDGPTTWLGDNDLQNAVNITNTYNASSLIFDFVPLTNKMRFDYIFASEQYLINGTQNQCNYTDAFAFILTNVTAGTPSQNLALVPGTNIPVTSSTIRGAGGLCQPSNAQYFASYNNNNSPIAYNGNTVPMTVEATVIPGHTYRIKIVIADQGNNLYDSAVFLRANSFNASIDLGTNRLIATNNALCANETLALNVSSIANSTYKWFKDGALITNQTSGIFNVTQPGVYKVEITQQNGCITEGEIKIEYDPFVYNNNVNLEVCGLVNDNSSTFNLLDAINLITTSPYSSIRFYRNNTNGVLSNIINENVPFQATTGTQVYAQIDSQNGCQYISTINLLINSGDIEPYNHLKCDADSNTSDGLSTFNLNEIAQNIRTENNYTPNYLIQFYLTVQDANNSTNVLPSNFTNTIPFQQQIFAKISVNGTCVAIIKVILNVVNTTTIPVKKILICQGDSITLSASVQSNSYIWNTNQTTKSIEISSEGTYTVTYLSGDGCEIVEEFQVNISNGPTEASFITTDFTGGNNSIRVIVKDTGIFEYSIDGINYQISNFFNGLAPGSYTIYIRDIAGCGELVLTAYILDYPRFLTPNGDGFNDTWRIPNLGKIDPGATISIFDRYGKLIYEMQPQFSWDGNRNGTAMPPTDYWFLIRYSNGKEFRGHFSLIR